MPTQIGDHMKRKMLRRALLSTAALLLAAIGAAYAAPGNVLIGTWTLNLSKSKISGDAPQSATAVYSMDGDNVKCVVDTTYAGGQAVHSEWTGKFDGKAYPVTGSPGMDMRSYRAINSHTIAATYMKGGKVVNRARIVVSADGNSRTVTLHGTDAKGMRSTSILYYDKQQ
jgi:hypothetical protein